MLQGSKGSNGPMVQYLPKVRQLHWLRICSSVDTSDDDPVDVKMVSRFALRTNSNFAACLIHMSPRTSSMARKACGEPPPGQLWPLVEFHCSGLTAAVVANGTHEN